MQQKNLRNISIVFIAVLMFSCKPKKADETVEVIEENPIQFVDKDLTQETKQLRNKLEVIASKGIAFGHQDATAYGIGWKHSGFPSDSDVKKVTGDFPAMFGFELGDLELGKATNLDSVNFDLMKKLIIEADKMGGLISVSWHMNNPVNGNNSWDKTETISKLLKGGTHRDKFENYVSKVADFFLDLKDEDGNLVPVIFRPWHEMSGSWFWWGGENTTHEQYKQFFRETVELFRDRYNVHNLLYVYSPDKIQTEEEYMAYYPGDEYADIIGIDIYDFGDGKHIERVQNSLAIVKKVADEKGKLFAFTETGREKINPSNWYTSVAYPGIKNSGAAYMFVWRNANLGHFYAPYPGHESVEDFIEFKNKPDILFLEDIKGL
ncbi:glycoside hydrolase family 26 protein [Urechidicola croceus]|uniref:Mannan endo-1,4-beta-mannosidase n=1 Tax=Urechidicola croceus TaxID=1850246 RepID=A0A1D8PAD6_9FLAO|nr:glycosyl hydrolase [Urechidicola croceus]AOW21530.1 hypothetical protein LPB138_12945 [Urechidicola croceus]